MSRTRRAGRCRPSPLVSKLSYGIEGSWHQPHEREYDAAAYLRKAADYQLAIRLLYDSLRAVPATEEVDRQHAAGSETCVGSDSISVESHDRHIGIGTQVAAAADDHCFTVRLQQHLHGKIRLASDWDDRWLRKALLIISVK